MNTEISKKKRRKNLTFDPTVQGFGALLFCERILLVWVGSTCKPVQSCSKDHIYHLFQEDNAPIPMDVRGL